MSTSLTLRIGADLSLLNARLKQAESRLKRFSFKAERIGRDLTTRVSLPIVGIGAAAVQAFAQFDRIEKGLAALGGSAQAGGEQFQRLNKIVLDTRTTLDLRTAALGAQRLQGAGLSAAFAERTIKQLGIAATVSGSAIDDVGGVLRQFTQIIGKGKVEQEDLNSILDRMPALGALIKKEFGGVTAEAIRETGISMEEFVSRTVAAIESNEDFQNVQGGLAKSFESFANAVQVGIAPLGEAIAKSLNLEQNLQKLGDFITEVSQKFADLNPNTQRFIVLTAAAAAAAGPLALAMGAVARSLPLLRSGFTLLPGILGSTLGSFVSLTRGVNNYGKAIITGTIPRNLAVIKSMRAVRTAFVLATGPIGLAVAAVALIAVSFKRAYDRSETFRAQLSGLRKAVQPIIDGVTSLASGIADKLGVNLEKVGSIFDVVFAGIAAGISFQVSIFSAFADTVSSVFTAIKQASNFEFDAAGKTLADTLINPLNIISTAKQAAKDAVKVFNETAESEPKTRSLLADRSGGGALGVDGTELSGGGGSGLSRSVQTVEALSVTIGDLVGDYERANIAALSVAGTNERLAGQASKFAVTLTEGPLKKYSDQLQVIAEKSDVFGSSFDTVGEKVNATKSALNALVEEGFTAYNSEVIFLQEQLALLTEQQDLNNQSLERTAEITAKLGSITGSAFESVEKALQQGQSAFKAFTNAVLGAVRKAIAAEIKLAVTTAASKALASAPFPFNIGLAAAAGAGASALFNGLLNTLKIPALAEGGIATGATLALIGEGRESEAVLPLSKLQSLIDMGGGGGGGSVRFRIAGEDLVAVYDQGRARQNRIF